MRNCAKQLDLFGVPIRVNFRGDATYKTLYGSCISILFCIVFITFALDQIVRLVNFTDVQVTSYAMPE